MSISGITRENCTLAISECLTPTIALLVIPRVKVAAMAPVLTAEDVVRRIAAECAYVDERGAASASGWSRRRRSCGEDHRLDSSSENRRQKEFNNCRAKVRRQGDRRSVEWLCRRDGRRLRACWPVVKTAWWMCLAVQPAT